ncbi:MAG: hypothetical protein LCH30_03730 [Proteobacteria bacterium]|nr:hypothetical protein [Pseudomonadota bacterium]
MPLIDVEITYLTETFDCKNKQAELRELERKGFSANQIKRIAFQGGKTSLHCLIRLLDIYSVYASTSSQYFSYYTQDGMQLTKLDVLLGMLSPSLLTKILSQPEGASYLSTLMTLWDFEIFGDEQKYKLNIILEYGLSIETIIDIICHASGKENLKALLSFISSQQYPINNLFNCSQITQILNYNHGFENLEILLSIAKTSIGGASKQTQLDFLLKYFSPEQLILVLTHPTGFLNLRNLVELTRKLKAERPLILLLERFTANQLIRILNQEDGYQNLQSLIYWEQKPPNNFTLSKESLIDVLSAKGGHQNLAKLIELYTNKTQLLACFSMDELISILKQNEGHKTLTQLQTLAITAFQNAKKIQTTKLNYLLSRFNKKKLLTLISENGYQGLENLQGLFFESLPNMTLSKWDYLLWLSFKVPSLNKIISYKNAKQILCSIIQFFELIKNNLFIKNPNNNYAFNLITYPDHLPHFQLLISCIRDMKEQNHLNEPDYFTWIVDALTKKTKEEVEALLPLASTLQSLYLEHIVDEWLEPLPEDAYTDTYPSESVSIASSATLNNSSPLAEPLPKPSPRHKRPHFFAFKNPDESAEDAIASLSHPKVIQ